MLGADRHGPEVAAQLIREYIYLYGAVSPKDGICVYLIMPTSNTACFQAFLDVLARRFARQDISWFSTARPTTAAATLRSRQHHVPFSPALFAGTQSERKYLG